MAAPKTWRKTAIAVGALVVLLALTSAEPAWAGIDPTGPQIVSFTPSDNGSSAYLQGQQVPANYICFPGSLGTPIVSCSGDVPVGQDIDTTATLSGGTGGSGSINGSSHTFTIHAVDAAGAQATLTTTYFVFDNIPPTITLTTPTDGAVYQVGALVNTNFSCDDPGGVGVAYCQFRTDPQGDAYPSGTPLPTSKPGTFTFTLQSFDFAGNLSSVIVKYTVVDVTPPQITIVSPGNGSVYRYGDPITPSYSCDDDVDGSNVPCTSTPATVDTSVGTHTFRVDSVDSSGNDSSANVTYTVADQTAPKITISSPADGATYHVGDPLTASFSCHDDVDGANVPCTATPSAVDTSPGTHTFRVDSVDSVGNAGSATVTYSVHYDFDGFYSPLVAEPGSVEVKAGEPVPVKFSLHGYQGLDVISRAAWHPCATSSDAATTASGTLTYNANLDRYTYAWTSSKSWAGTCTEFLFTLRDGTTHAAYVTFR